MKKFYVTKTIAEILTQLYRHGQPTLENPGLEVRHFDHTQRQYKGFLKAQSQNLIEIGNEDLPNWRQLVYLTDLGKAVFEKQVLPQQYDEAWDAAYEYEAKQIEKAAREERVEKRRQERDAREADMMERFTEGLKNSEAVQHSNIWSDEELKLRTTIWERYGSGWAITVELDFGGTFVKNFPNITVYSYEGVRFSTGSLENFDDFKEFQKATEYAMEIYEFAKNFANDEPFETD